MHGTNAESNGSHAAAISNMVVQLFSQYTGRGPTKAKTHFNEDLIAVVLQDAMTRAERSLVADGQSDLVLNVRRTFQKTMSSDLTSGVERITGRRVVAFFSDSHGDPDMSIEAFVLAPLPDDDGPGSGPGADPEDAA